jgi:hypothetical protein
MSDEIMQVKAEERGKILLSFVLKTKEGFYAPIDEAYIPYSRIEDEREPILTLEDEYYYSIS